MINTLRKYLLLPFSFLYAIVTESRNKLYDWGVLKQEVFEKPVISVGNLNMGGTGKTPQIEYLINLLKNKYKIAVLSRGYKRKSKGFIVAGKESSVEELGDEAYQIARKFPDITVSVSEKRAPAIKKLIDDYQVDVILLDDAFQHRQVKPGFNIVLSPSSRIFTDDFILPSGNLRECKHNIKRADMLVITKMNPQTDKNILLKKIKKFYPKDIFFSSIEYANFITDEKKEIPWEKIKDSRLLLVTGIANPQPLYAFLSKKNVNFDRLKFGDHHAYTQADVQQIASWYKKQKEDNKFILTTEKDFVKLKDMLDLPLFYLPIKTKIENDEVFNKKILDYVDSRKPI